MLERCASRSSEHFIDGSITAMCDDLQIFGGDLFKNSQK